METSGGKKKVSSWLLIRYASSKLSGTYCLFVVFKSFSGFFVITRLLQAFLFDISFKQLFNESVSSLVTQQELRRFFFFNKVCFRNGKSGQEIDSILTIAYIKIGMINKFCFISLTNIGFSNGDALWKMQFGFNVIIRRYFAQFYAPAIKKQASQLARVSTQKLKQIKSMLGFTSLFTSANIVTDVLRIFHLAKRNIFKNNRSRKQLHFL